MAEMVTLRCPEGAFDYPIAEGVRSFYPYRENIYSQDQRESGGPWLVDVPDYVAAHFIPRGFILMAQSQRDERPEMVRMSHPLGTGCVWGNMDHESQSYEPDSDGCIVVPIAAVTDLTSHGFFRVPSEEEPPPPKAEPRHQPPSQPRVPRR
jgi:hypothetical protein